MPRLSTSLAPALLFPLAGCSGRQSSLDPAGPQALRLYDLWLLFADISLLVYLLTMAALIWAVWHRRSQAASSAPELLADPQRSRRMTFAVGTATALTIVTLFVLLIASIIAGRGLVSLVQAKDPLQIRVVGHQWWWEVQYMDPVPSNMIMTANEIHIPTGRPIMITLLSQDVIHSFWVPNLHGKMDLIPGKQNILWLQADRPGVYRGQCAEFCGHQHAHMAFQVIAESDADFARWQERQRKPARSPGNPLQQRGQQVFLTSSCVMCHMILGTRANGTVGPNLTHVGSRATLAAGTLPNRPGYLAGWIVDPQNIKPGNHMHPNALSSEDLQALLAYLESLE